MNTDQDLSTDDLVLQSPAFSAGGEIPAQYSCDGENSNPPFTINGVDALARSLVLMMDDPDAPGGSYDHWLVYDISPEATEIKEGREPSGTLGVGTSGKLGYYGPCPPGERHRYVFTLYALDTVLGLPEGMGKEEVMEAMTGNVLQKTELTVYFER
ncbi:MAG: YbhB/YbcL family Raf kinase inhibitor-like protein [Candidatus Paceibacterota bacterium]